VSEVNDYSTIEPTPAQVEKSIFTILGGTTIPDRAAIVRAECREGSLVELRTPEDVDANSSRIDVWLECRSLLGLVKAWKKIGHVPDEAAAALLPVGEERRHVVAYGTVKSIYAPAGRDEAVVTVEIRPHTPA
jgi:hypothetical protein